MSLFLRLWLSLVCTFGLLILGLGWAEHNTLQRALLREIDDNLQHRALWLAAELRQGRLPQGLMIPNQGTLEELAKIFVEIRDSKGQLLSSSNNLADQQLPKLAEATTGFFIAPTPEGHRLRIYQLRPFEEGPRILVAESLELVDRSRQSSLLRVVTLGLATTLLAAGLAHRLLGKTLGPLFSVSRAAGAIAATGDLSILVPAQSAIPEVDQVAHTLNGLLRRVQELISAQQRLIQDTSHELRNPLTVLQVDLEMLARHDLEPAMRSEIAQEMQGELERLTRLVQDLLLISWAEARPSLELESLRLDLLLERILERYRHLAGPRKLKFFGYPVSVKADPLRLEQIIRNLVDNAIRYTPPEGRISLWILRPGSQEEVGSPVPKERLLPTVPSSRAQVTVVVQDDGCGIDPQHWDSLFQRFFRIEPDRNRQAGGIGLGLPLARALARAMGGDLWVYSQPQRGSSFMLSLNLDQDD